MPATVEPGAWSRAQLPVPNLPAGRLSANVVHFVRVLRRAGLPVGPAKVIDALGAVEAVGLDSREDFRAALSATLVSRAEHLPLFEQAFDLYWRNPRLVERMLAALLPHVEGLPGEDDGAPAMPARLAEAMLPPLEREALHDDPDAPVEFDATFTYSAREILQKKDFATMNAEELAAVKRLLRRLRLPLPELPSRRYRPDPRGARADLRATLKRMRGAAGMATPLARRTRRHQRPPLVVLCDISGSMDRYARMLLHFVHAITNDRDRVHTFVFGTRLTNVTRYLKHRDVDVALERITAAVDDWSGGTLIGVSLAAFNRRWSRRVLGQNAVVLLITDGLDADAGTGLAFEMERLAKSSRRLIWLNPLLRYADFEARPAGIRAMLPYVDEFRPVHNLDSLVDIAGALEGARHVRSARGARPLHAARRVA